MRIVMLLFAFLALIDASNSADLVAGCHAPKVIQNLRINPLPSEAVLHNCTQNSNSTELEHGPQTKPVSTKIKWEQFPLGITIFVHFFQKFTEIINLTVTKGKQLHSPIPRII